MANQGLTEERRKLKPWLKTLRPEMVIKELALAWSQNGGKLVEGNIYYKVLETEPLKLELLYTERRLRWVDTRLVTHHGAIVKPKDHELLDLRPVEANEYREVVMAMFGD